MSGGGGSPSSTTNTIQTLPAYVQPYYTQLMANAQSLTQQPYTPYQGQQTADFSPTQNQAFQNIQQMQTSPQLDQATGMAGLAGLQSGQYANQSNNFYTSPQAQSGYQDLNAPQLQNFQMGPAQQVHTQNYTGNNVGQYMSPYMNDVVNQQKTAAIQDYARQLPQLGADAQRVGGLGGTRSALVQSEAQRNLQDQLANIQATGSQAGFQNAQQQFNTQQQANLTAQQANQQAGLATGQSNLQAALGVQQLGSSQDLAAQQANQSAQMGQNSMLNQFNLQNAGQQAQYGAQGQQIGLQGLAQQMAAAGQLGNLGQQQFQQQAGINTALLGTGALQQQQDQSLLNSGYQNYLNQLNYPYNQLTFLRNMIQPQAMNSSSTVYAGQPNTAGQVAGLGMGLGSLFGALG